MSTFAGEPKQFVANVSVQMSHKFSTIMQQLLHEALEGRFATKQDAVMRRDQLLAESKKQAAPADSDAPADSVATAVPAEPAELPLTHPDHSEDRQVLDDSQDVW